MSRNRMILLGILTVSAFAIAGNSAVSRADDPVLKERFLKEYPEASRRLHEAYRRIRGSGIETINVTRGGKASTSIFDVDFAIDGDFQKREARRSANSPTSSETFSRTLVVTPTRAFAVDRETEKGQLVLKATEATSRRSLDMAMSKFRDDELNAPFQSIWPFEQVNKEPGFRLGDVTAIERDGEFLVEVKYTRERKGGGQTYPSFGRVLFAPGRSWAILEHDLRVGKGGKTIKVEYGPLKDGVPSLKKVTSLSGPDSQIFEFRDFQFGPTPLDAFSMKAAGLPELDLPLTTRSNRTPSYFLAAGGVAGLSAILAAYYARSRRMSTPVSGREGESNP